ATRRVPYLSDVPVLGNLFRYDAVEESRGELLFIMTPYIVRGDDDIEMLKQMESSRMSWCLADVVNIHGEVGLSGAYEGQGYACGPTVVYPDQAPQGVPPSFSPRPAEINGPELVAPPTPIEGTDGELFIPDAPPPALEFGGPAPVEPIRPAAYYEPRRRASPTARPELMRLPQAR
ncbi:MAG: hypothetical protein KDA41_13120, partial [Planctomycetales bacterium]|nr:hypothetical protein [Planctomycetales bacterium]